MRILLLNYEYPPLGGGAGIATAALAKELASRGVTVDVVTAGTGAAAERRTGDRLDPSAGEHGLSLYRVACRRSGVHEATMLDAASYLAAALPVVRRLLSQHSYDAVHIFFSLPTGALLPLLNLRGVPVVVSLRGSDVPGYDPYHKVMQRVHQILAPLTRWIWRRADRVVPVCESLGQLARQTCPDLRYTVIPNGVDLRLFHPPAQPRSAEPRPIRCLAVARLTQRKGLGDLIQALALLERGRFELEIVGAGPDEQLLRRLAIDVGVGHEVRFSGALDRAAVAERYRQADIFTLPSSAEAFGNVFAEALASGLPIVGSSAGGIPDLVDHGTNGLLVAPGDTQALAAAIRYLGDDAELRSRMGLTNRARAVATLDWAHVTGRYHSMYAAMGRTLPSTALAPVPTVSAL
jgi:glycosyltransferase involved in cell wall biosynthesis